jgi:hypothetical protein
VRRFSGVGGFAPMRATLRDCAASLDSRTLQATALGLARLRELRRNFARVIRRAYPLVRGLIVPR